MPKTIQDRTNQTDRAATANKEVTFESPQKDKPAARAKKPIIMPTDVTPATFAAKSTGKTPLKVKKAIDKGIAASEIKERWENCTGIPLRVHKFNKSLDRISRKCSICNGGTQWYCIGCKSWFCMTGQDTNTREKTFVSHTMAGTNAGTDSDGNVMAEEYVFEMSCYHQKHQAAWERAEGKERLEETAKKIQDCKAELETIKGIYNLDL